MNLRQKQSGSSLVVVIITMATLMVIVGIAAEYTTNINRNVQRSNTLETAIAVGDGCIDLLFANWRNTCRGTATTALATSAFQSIALPTSTNFPTLQSLPSFSFGASATDYYGNNTANPPTISNFKVVSADAEWNALATASATPEPMFGQIPGIITSLNANTNPAIKTTSLTLNYIASADITLPTLKGNVVAKVRRVFQKEQLSPWNFAIFYVDPLEIHPGPLFTVTGWVHTNSDLYTAHNTLTFADKVTYGADWNIAFMPGDLQHLSDTIASPNYPSNLPPARDQSLQPFGTDSTLAFSTSDSNPNNDSYRELIEPPSTGFTDPLAGQRYWDQASIIIQVTDNSNSHVAGFDGVNGHDLVKFYTVDPLTGITTQLTSGSLYTAFAGTGAISTNQTIQDNREGASERVATLDVSKLENNASGNPSYIGGIPNAPIVYMYDTSATSSARRAIRIKNGSKIPTSGLTVASNNPVYIQGDFNTGGTGATVPSNATNAYASSIPAPQVSGYTRAPTSILADAVNILSNNWSDANSGTMPLATNTTVNTAVIAGIVPTGGASGTDGSYSGGAENFPRFLEDWSQQGGSPQPTLTYYGSMVELYKSAQSIGEWGSNNVYSPPNREWFFDSNFQTKPPPGTIMIYSYIKGKWSVL